MCLNHLRAFPRCAAKRTPFSPRRRVTCRLLSCADDCTRRWPVESRDTPSRFLDVDRAVCAACRSPAMAAPAPAPTSGGAAHPFVDLGHRGDAVADLLPVGLRIRDGYRRPGPGPGCGIRRPV